MRAETRCSSEVFQREVPLTLPDEDFRRRRNVEHDGDGILGVYCEIEGLELPSYVPSHRNWRRPTRPDARRENVGLPMSEMTGPGSISTNMMAAEAV